MRSHLNLVTSLCVLAVAAGIAVACADNNPIASVSPIAGLEQTTPSDTSPNPGDSGTTFVPAGYVHGFVLGAITPNGVIDTLTAAPRLANVKVVAYPRQASGALNDAGPPAATVFTDASGEFKLPVLPAGDYYVTFAPPAGSLYRGAYTQMVSNAQTGTSPWWIVLNAL